MANKRIFNIKDYGAVVGDLFQTEAIQTALDECFLSGGGRVVVPCGIYRTGGLRLRSNTELYLESGAILKASIDPEDYFAFKTDKIEPIVEYTTEPRRSVYPYSRWNNAIIRVINADNVSIIGEKGSYIDGGNCYDAEGEEDYRGPHAINIQNSENIRLEGYTVTDSANWAHAIFNTNNIKASFLTVLGGHDGFDVRTCDNVLIEDCVFYTGDDCIAGFDNCDVVIRNCVFNSSCSALRFGGNNVLVENCKAFAPGRFAHRYTMTREEQKSCAPTGKHHRRNMLTAFLYYCDHRAVIRKAPGDIVIRSCEFVAPDILFSLPFSNDEIWCCNRSLSSIKFENCKITDVCKPINIVGDANEPLDFALENVEISARAGFENENFIEAENYSAITLKNVHVSGYTEPTALLKSEGKLDFENSTLIKIDR